MRVLRAQSGLKYGSNDWHAAEFCDSLVSIVAHCLFLSYLSAVRQMVFKHFVSGKCTARAGKNEYKKMKSIALLDGGLGQEINSRSSRESSHSLWSVMVMHEEPEVVVTVHEDFIKAGARVLTLNNYTASVTRLARFGLAEKFDDTHRLAIDLMHKAIDNIVEDSTKENITREDINIAGCLMPLAASYVAEAALNYQDSYDQYCRLIEVQLEGVDMFLAETISNITEAKAVADALASFDQLVHIGLTLNDDLSNTLRSGERIEDAVAELANGQLDVLMVNCCYPEAIDQALPVLTNSGLRFGAYANGFTSIEAMRPGSTVDGLKARTDLTPESYSKHALRWADAGAAIVGGCCEIGPAHISHLRDTLFEAGYNTGKLL